MWAFERAHKIKACRDNLPDQPYDTLQPLFDSDLLTIVIAAGETPGRARELESEHNNAKGGAPEHGTDARDDSAMDFTEKPAPSTAARQELPSTPVKPAMRAYVEKSGPHGVKADFHIDRVAPKPDPPRQEPHSSPLWPAVRAKQTIDTNPTRIVMEGHFFWRSKFKPTLQGSPGLGLSECQ